VSAGTYSFLGPDPVEVQVRQVLDRLAAGDPPSAFERRQVDVKEEVGRRGRAGIIGPPRSQSEATARYLAEEMSCMANSDGGGAIIVGVADDGTRIGTAIESEWLRHRIYELTSGTLTVDVREASLDGTRLLVLVTHEAIEPIRVGGKVRWRVDDHCVEVDPTSWHTAKLARRGADWSAGPSGHTVADADPVALGIARRYLDAGGDTRAAELAQASNEDLLRRLNVVTGDGKLTNAGSLLFVATPTDAIDYIRSDAPGTDSTNRICTSRPLIEQIYQVEQAALAADRVVHLSEGFAHGQVRAIPERALRESIVNGVVHRDWLSPLPTTVERIGDTLTVSSPGGFIGGIDPSNIITHPAVPRYRSLAETVATLRLAEREGIGVDRMVADMLALGRPGPEISEMAGPYVRVALLGGEPDQSTAKVLGMLTPRQAAGDVDLLLMLSHLEGAGWIDADTAAPLLQRRPAETAGALDRLVGVKVAGAPLVVPVAGVPADPPPAYRLSNDARDMLANRTGWVEIPEARKQMILAWSWARGRVSST